MVSRLLAQVLFSWLQQRGIHQQVQVATMDGFTSYSTAVATMLLQVVKVMGLFHVLHLAAEKLQVCQQRLKEELQGRQRTERRPIV